jgi:lysozyme
MTVPVDVPVPPGAKSVDIRLNFVPAPTPKEIPQRGAPGIDVSRHQGTIDWDKVKTAGIEFVGIRATMGATGRDDKFTFNWVEASRVGILRARYHYFANKSAGIPQAYNFLAVLESDLGELPIVIDIEPTSGQVIADKHRNTQEILSFLKECEKKTGIRPIIYTNGWAWGVCTTIPDWSSDYPLWLAQYTITPEPKIPQPWHRYACWQYSASGRIPGIENDKGQQVDVDLDRWGEL